MPEPLHILHIEDSPEDSELVREILHRDGVACRIERVQTRAEVFDKLQKGSFELILADFRLPQFSGLDALEIARALKPEVPFIFVSGVMGEATAIDSLRNGATDYVLKDQLSRLIPAVRRAMEECEERKLRRQLQERLREVARLEAVSTLSSGIAHDFNNILTIIMGHASLLSLESGNPERVLELAATISAAGRRASEVVQQLQTFAEKKSSHAAPLELNQRLKGLLLQVKESLPARVELAFQAGADLPEITADVTQLEQMLHNLVANAVEAMPEGGRITISTAVVSGKDVPHLPESSSEHYVSLGVKDTGRGMDAVTREHIFEPFFTTKERRRGTGLGLSVVYGIMRGHGGWIHVDSSPGKGTSVVLYFPSARQTARKPAGNQGSDPALSGKETVLVIEDEIDVAFFLQTILRSHGYRVLLAHNSDQAHASFASANGVDLVFSDIGLPGTDGIAICQELKQRLPDLRVIMSSGYSPKEFRERLDELAPDAFLPKPYAARGILRIVRDVLDRTASGSALPSS